MGSPLRRLCGLYLKPEYMMPDLGVRVFECLIERLPDDNYPVTARAEHRRERGYMMIEQLADPSRDLLPRTVTARQRPHVLFPRDPSPEAGQFDRGHRQVSADSD